MKYIYAFALCFLLSGAQANYVDTLKALGHTALDYGKQALQSALDSLTTDGVKTLVQTGASALLSSLFGKRDVSPDHLKAFELLKEQAQNVENVFKSYSHQLQLIYDEIHSLSFLKGDVAAFFHKIETVKASHNAALNNIVKTFIAETTKLGHNKRGLTDFLSGLQGSFAQTVSALKQTFGGVTDKLNQQSGGLLTSLATGLANLNGGLFAKFAAAKETAAQFLATGQETLANLHHKGTDVIHQTVNGLKGQAQQAVDTLLHPGN